MLLIHILLDRTYARQCKVGQIYISILKPALPVVSDLAKNILLYNNYIFL